MCGFYWQGCGTEASGVCINNWWWSMPGHAIQQRVGGVGNLALLGVWVFAEEAPMKRQ